MESDKRSEFVLGTTISELILLLFFLLLLLFGYYYMDGTRRDKEQQDKIAALIIERNKAEAGLRKLYALVGTAPTPEQFKTLVAIDQLEALLAAKEQAIGRAEARIDALNAILDRINNNKTLSTSSRLELEKLADLELCQSRIKSTEVSERELSDANRRNKELTAKLATCSGKGEEFVSCWRGDDGKIEYVFETFISKDGIRVTRRWPERRDSEMTRFSDEMSLVDKTIKVDDFLRLTSALYRDSEQKACRYYVVISGNRSEMDATMFTTYQRIQDHFYHFPNVK